MDDVRMGILAATTANAAGAKVAPKNFLLRREEEEEPDLLEKFRRAMGER